MKKKEKNFLLILIIVSIIIVIFEKNLIYELNKKYYLSEISGNEKIIGLADVSGEGIIMNINDGLDLVHQEDLVILLDELKNAGAEAISINEKRITPNTYVYCDGGVILIDEQKIGNPFTIKAIGNSDKIYNSIMREKGYISTLTNDGIKVDVKKENNVQICKTNKEISKKINTLKNEEKKLTLTSKIAGKAKMTDEGVEIYIYPKNEKDVTALTLMQLVNDLNSAGVQAISINENRVLSMSDLMDANNKYVLLDGVPIKAPYLVKAIGNIKKINETLNYKNSTINKLKEKETETYIDSKFFVTVEEYDETIGKNKIVTNYLK